MDVSVAGADGQRQGRGLTLEEETAYKDAFAAVMVDTTLGFNIFGGYGGGISLCVCCACLLCTFRGSCVMYISVVNAKLEACPVSNTALWPCLFSMPWHEAQPMFR